ncbi:nucleoside:H+ symporter, major facilitator superfamily [Aquitalea magnusonii]|uniref:Nucleoside:H+ symporter, major facilitator superfamily n=1 Tax=Aquitalea magnusonii TaxID=332411 RepID=A0A3G9GKT9_9NEIS|nr:MFS transporter [Aquitalea magnusonii]BBF86077.1 nucleoside:H+ symporter, major facilitator superfamily [Aquitalea magnusonii]
MSASSAVAAPSLRPFALFYFAYFAFQGLFGPFWGLYLESLSFSALQISVLMALSTLARIVAPGFWGWLADRQGRRRAIIISTSLCSALAFALVGLGNGFWWIFTSLAVSHFFWAGALPLVEASTAYLTRAQPGRYSRVRVWGSIGFVCLSMVGGYVLDLIHLANLPWALLLLLACIVLAGWFVPDVSNPRHHQAAGPIWQTLRQPRVLALFACCFLMAYAHGPYYTFYSIGLRHAGYDKGAIGLLWSVGVISEILVFLLMPRIMGRFALERLMLASLLTAVLRFVLIACAVEQPVLAVLAQSMHALTFGLHHATSVGLIHRLFAQQHQGRAQGLYIIASFGVGGSSGGLVGGLLWPHGGMLPTFGMSVVAAALGVLVCLRWLRPEPCAKPTAA